VGAVTSDVTRKRYPPCAPVPNADRVKEEAMSTKSNSLRDNIFGLLRDTRTSVDEDLEVLSQCVADIRHRRILGDIARESGLALTGFLTNHALELYYDIKRGRHDLGYIAKG
jgi:hypothetical protein